MEKIDLDKLTLLMHKRAFLKSMGENFPGTEEERRDSEERLRYVEGEIKAMQTGLSEEEKGAAERRFQIERQENLITVMEARRWSEPEIRVEKDRLELLRKEAH